MEELDKPFEEENINLPVFADDTKKMADPDAVETGTLKGLSKIVSGFDKRIRNGQNEVYMAPFIKTS